MDSSKMISEQLFLLIPMLYNQIIRPIEGALRAKISPLQFYALMALKREGCMTMSALSAHCGVSKIIGFPSFQHSILSQPVLSPAKRKGRRAGFRTVFPQLFQWERLKCLRRRAALEWHAYEY